MPQLHVREDQSEVIDYTSPDLSIKSVLGRLSYFPSKAAVCHWHSELEFIIVLEGQMDYFVNQTVYRLSSGTGIIVNSGQLHFGYAVDSRECAFIVLLIHPSLLGGHAYIESKYINPLLYDTGSEAIFLSEAVDWNRQALLLIKTLFQLTQEQPDQYELQTHIQFASLWLLLYQNTIAKNGSQKTPAASSAHLKNMIGYIQKHYAEKISLNDIAAAGAVCRSKCCDLFKQTLHQTPFEYLLHYRIQKSLSLLADSNLSITAIAAACGFSGASYYTEVFRKLRGIPPGAYRKSSLQ